MADDGKVDCFSMETVLSIIDIQVQVYWVPQNVISEYASASDKRNRIGWRLHKCYAQLQK